MRLRVSMARRSISVQWTADQGRQGRLGRRRSGGLQLYESIALQLPVHSKCRLGWERLRGRLAGRGGKLIEGSEEEIQLRRMIGGLFEKSGKKELDNENWAKPKSRVEHVRESGFCLQELGREMTAEFEDTLREELRTGLVGL